MEALRLLSILSVIGKEGPRYLDINMVAHSVKKSMSLTDHGPHGGKKDANMAASLVPSVVCNAELVPSTLQMENLAKSISSTNL